LRRAAGTGTPRRGGVRHMDEARRRCHISTCFCDPTIFACNSQTTRNYGHGFSNLWEIIGYQKGIKQTSAVRIAWWGSQAAIGWIHHSTFLNRTIDYTSGANLSPENSPNESAAPPSVGSITQVNVPVIG